MAYEWGGFESWENHNNVNVSVFNSNVMHMFYSTAMHLIHIVANCTRS